MYKDTSIYQSMKRVSRMKYNTVFDIVFDTPKVRRMVIKMNTEDQLFDKGVDSEGVDLENIGGEYSFITKDLKSRSGQPFDRVTLKDTGSFYNSWRVYVANGVIVISADTIKDGKDLQNRWGDNILGLTDNSLNALKSYALIKYKEYIFSQWGV